jgi:hypothetical protein
MLVAAAPSYTSAQTTLPSGATGVWKFGYGSNMSQAFLRDKKKVRPIR